MSSSLLGCTICPKLPKFSDTSHLLTHVSSKGHLSHLHKLQVRSHQEIAAIQQLAAYDQWYQQHGLGQLLSERMQQKDAKKNNPRRFKSESEFKREDASAPRIDPSLEAVSYNNVPDTIVPQLRSAYARPRQNLRQSIRPMLPSDEASVYDSSPLRGRRYGTVDPWFHADHSIL